VNGKCLALAGASTQNGAKVIQWPCGGGDEQVWARISLDRFQNKNSGLCLAIPGTNPPAGTEAIQWTCSESVSQQWMW
jgi:hypothetical protein